MNHSKLILRNIPLAVCVSLIVIFAIYNLVDIERFKNFGENEKTQLQVLEELFDLVVSEKSKLDETELKIFEKFLEKAQGEKKEKISSCPPCEKCPEPQKCEKCKKCESKICPSCEPDKMCPEQPKLVSSKVRLSYSRYHN